MITSIIKMAIYSLVMITSLSAPAKELVPLTTAIKQQKILYDKIKQTQFTNQTNTAHHSFFSDYFLGAPYLANTLENHKEERLTIRLDVFDCVTYVESVTALTLISTRKNNTFMDFCNQITKLRYRNGIIDGYSSRLHYFSDWIYENNRRGYIIDITKKLGGIPIKKNISSMSSNPDRYPQLKDTKQLKIIKDIELNLSNKTFYYISTEQLKEIASFIPDGAIIAIVTNNKAIHISHTGFARIIDGTLKLQHASNIKKRVVISNKSLYDYVKSNKKSIGVMVALINMDNQ